MKRILSFVLVLAMMLSLLALSAYAAPGAGRRNRAAAKCTVCTEFIDEDGDGVCDNCPNGGVRPQDGRGREAGRGMCRGYCGACRRG